MILKVLLRGKFVNRESTSNDTKWYPSSNISNGTVKIGLKSVFFRMPSHQMEKT